MSDYVVGRKGMISGQGEIFKRIFRKYQGKSGNTWYLAIQENSGDNVYVDCHDPKSDGFGGATLTFELENGDIDKVKGPWHSNSEAFTRDTGIDITKKHLTFVVISEGRDQDEHYRTVLKNVLYKDEKPQLGDFDRWMELAAPFVEGRKNLFYYSESAGGSSCGPVIFEGKVREDIKKFLKEK